MTDRPSLSRGVGFGALSFAMSAGLGIVTSIVMARVYGVEVLGEAALAAAPVGALAFLSTVREQPAFIREVAPLPPGSERVTGLFIAVFAFSAGLTAVSTLLVAAVSYFLLRGPIEQPGLVGPAGVFLLSALLISNTNWNFDSVFAAFGDGQRLFWIRLSEAVTYLATLIAFSEVFPNVWGPTLAVIVSWMAGLVFRLGMVRVWLGARVTRTELRAGFAKLPEIVRFGLKMTPGSIASGANQEYGTWILGAMASVGTVGAYSRAWSLSRRLMEFNGRIAEMVFPALVRRRTEGDVTGFNRAFVEATRYATIGLGLIAAVGGGSSRAVMELFGPDFTSAAPTLAITLAVPLTTTLVTLNSAALLALGRPAVTTYVSLVASATTLGITLGATALLGISGPAIALLGGSLIGVAGGYLMVQRYTTVGWRGLWPWRERFAVALSYATAFAAAWTVAAVVTWPVSLFASGLVGLTVYALVFWVSGGVRPADYERIAGLRVRLMGRQPA